MKIKDFFSKHNAETKNEGFQENDAQEFSLNLAAELSQLEKDGKLELPAQEYASDKEFIKLAAEFPVAAAVRIYDAEKKTQEALEKGKKEVIDDIYRRRQLPRSIKNAQPVTAENDFSTMSSEDFNRIKRRLAAAKR